MPVLIVPIALAVVVALLCILALLAYEQLAKSVSYVMPAWHIPGLGSLRGWIQSHLRDGYNSLAGYLDNYVHVLVTMVTHPTVFLRTFLSGIVATFASTHLLLWAILNHTVPVAMTELRKYASATAALVEARALGWYHSALHYASDLVNYALDTALAEVAAAKAQALADYHLGLKFSQDLANYVLHAALAEAAAVRADALNWYHLGLKHADDLAGYVQAQAVLLYKQTLATIETRFRQAVTEAETFAKAEATAAVAGLNGALVTDIEHAWPAVIAGIDGVIDVAGDAFSDVVGDLRGISRDLPNSLPAAIAATTAIAIPLLRLAKDCTMPNCKNLSQVGRDLQALFGAVEGGAIIALIAEAASDPAGTAHTVESIFTPLVDTAVHVIWSEIGVS